ncbi:tricarboxylate transporter [Roseospira marina]|uniref:Tricarboxylate transporter n=1 Tax=Roseospira marina TaxID=140057 RepID=A0A5M6I7Q1_9PROT|nr:tripartite tricarboxylate transporter permease [Roseospira marina]KAA5604261.1 tricarboxylate transporter [Roseospira marina]MBB4315589.1 putative tricarboxylic transport membrane protein [Roseospira marina]MBB5088585.1 putative tricarboxylic transport membrane protein [Roseospira marina]
MEETLTHLLNGFDVALTPYNLMFAFAGAIMGLIVGAMPGIGSLAGIALLLPLTFKLDPTAAIIMLAAIYYANMYGGSFSGILLNIPGDSPAVMTALDGHRMTRNGRAGKALFTAILASSIGGTIGIIIITIMGPLLAALGLRFGPAEMTAIILMAFTSIGWLLGENPTKGGLATCLGLMLAVVGVDMARGMSRFAFGFPELLSGISFVPLVIGMFGFSQVMILMTDERRKKRDAAQAKDTDAPQADAVPMAQQKIRLRDSLLTRQEFFRVVPVATKSGLLGTIIGVLPGAGATMAAFLCYIFEKRTGGNGAAMGEGVIEGVAAPEAGNNAAAAGAFAPLLSLGIPGGGTTAVLLGGLMMWGLTPGPLLFTEQPEFSWGLIASMYVGNIMCLIVAVSIIPFLTKILQIPVRIIAPIITVVCVVGAFSVNNSAFDIGVMLASGVVGYFLVQYKYPTAPLLLAFVLAPILERSMRAAFEISGGQISIFYKSPIALSFLLVIVAICLVPMMIKAVRALGQRG